MLSGSKHTAFIMMFDNKSQSCIKRDTRLPLFVSFYGQILSKITNKIVTSGGAALRKNMSA